MAGLSIMLFLVILLVISPALCAKNVVNMRVETEKADDDQGHVENCGNTEFTASWTPKVLSPDGTVNVTVGYHVPYTLKSGFVNASVYFAGDDTPFVGYSNKFTCEQISAYMHCPIYQGFSFHQTRTIPNLRVLSSYPGDYQIIAKVYNQDMKEMFCAKVLVSVKEIGEE